MKLKTLLIGLVCASFSMSAFAAKNFKANVLYDQKHPFTHYGYLTWADYLKDISGGDLNAKVYTGTVLLAANASMQGLRDNVVQVAHHPAIYTPSELPVANAMQELGFNFDNQMAVIAAVSEFSMNNPVQLAEWNKSGLVYLGAYATSPYVLFCRQPINSLADLKGKRIRTAGSTVADWVKQVEGIAVNVSSSEMYSGLDRGSLDCASNSPLDLQARSLWEVAPYTVLVPTGVYWSGPEWGFNKKFWAGLNDQERQWFKEASAYSMANIVVNYKKEDKAAIEFAKGKGNTVSEAPADIKASVDAFRKKSLNDVYDLAENKYKVQNSKETLDDFINTYNKWVKLLADKNTDSVDDMKTLFMTNIFDKLPANYGM
ncbi:C4-dicarboxylate TRAP transporter substrate-binding protein [Pusillimonas sp. ANT_WB101]|uniref:C4-dicarboxylate TRAP transporter substrate-binding protein n=1 Tax=Pusillimonas sp. ANT_WB101 TaxID=2597356 RepID=UPI0011ED8AD7|nr:C4-dicarboxylate TRAP transporter substrate-binding protein [Pusillimonas sp. ANT_WB101]KAA0892581.1 C4-dicarboxylate ABC transporter substrate-binding protein [Pusillimonas sp. ANT_WB101]